MPLTHKDIDEFKAIYARLYGEVLSDREAWSMGNRLVRLFDVLTRPKDMPRGIIPGPDDPDADLPPPGIR